eukprot:401213_1
MDIGGQNDTEYLGALLHVCCTYVCCIPRVIVVDLALVVVVIVVYLQTIRLVSIGTFDGFQTSGALVSVCCYCRKIWSDCYWYEWDRGTMNGMGLSGSTASYGTVVEL